MKEEFVLRCSFLFLALFAVSTYSAEIFVRSGAVGGNGSTSNPYGSIQQALNAATSGDTITLYNGTYTGVSNTMLTLGSLSSITIRGYDNDPAITVIQWTNSSYEPFINFNTTAINVTIQGLGFYGRNIADDPVFGLTTPTFSITTGSLVMSNCRFENFVSTGNNPSSILYIYLKSSTASATISNTDFVRGTGQYGLQVDGGTLVMNSCNFVSHPGINTAFGSCVFSRSTANSIKVNITNSNFVSSQGPLRFLKGNVTLSSNSFFNDTDVVTCGTTGSVTIVPSNNKFCGSNSGSTCASVSTTNIRPFDGCGVCDGNNANKDCNGVCWGTTRGSFCTTKKTYWVSTTGGGDGTSRNKTLTLPAAISSANYGDKIIMLSGKYSGGINTLGKAITIQSENGIPEYDNVSIACGSTKSAFVFNSKESFDTVIKGITVTGCGNSSTSAVTIGADTGVSFKSVNFNSNGVDTGFGAISLFDGFVRLDDVTFFNNTAYQGAAIYGSTSNTTTKVTYLNATNTRFLTQYATDRGGAVYFGGGVVEIGSSYFSGCDASSLSGAIHVFLAYASLTNNSFSNIGISAALASGKSISCSNMASTSSQSANTFCGSASTVSVSCPLLWPVAPSLSGVSDACGVCNGNNATLDCSGTCWGRQSTDLNSVCCFSPSRDCSNQCYGTYVYDTNNTCCNQSLIDTCNICGGDNSCSSFNCTPSCGTRGVCTAPNYCTCNTTFWTGNTTGCNTPVCSGAQDCGTRGNCTAPGVCNCNTSVWTGSTTGCNTPVCSGAQDCGTRGNCVSPGVCSCNTTLWTGNTTGCNTPVCSGAQDCGTRGNCTSPGVCACNALWTGSTTGCNTSVCSGAQDCGNRGNCTAPGFCSCNTTYWTGNTTGCNTPVCSGAQNCGTRGSCTSPGVCTCNTTLWTGNTTGCNTPVCSGAQDCGPRGTCVAPGTCNCNTTLWTGNTTGCNTPVCDYGLPVCNGGVCVSPGLCLCNNSSYYMSACPNSTSPSTTPSSSPAVNSSASVSPIPSAAPSNASSNTSVSPTPSVTPSRTPSPANNASSPSSSPIAPSPIPQSSCSQCSSDSDCSNGQGVCVTSSIGSYCSCLSGFGGCNCSQVPSAVCSSSYSQVDSLSANFQANATVDYLYPMLYVHVDAILEESIYGNGNSTPSNPPPYSTETLIFFGPTASSFPSCSYPNGGYTWIDLSAQPGSCVDKYISNMTWSFASINCGFAAVNGSRNYTQSVTIQRKYNLNGILQRTEQTTRSLSIIFPEEISVSDSNVTVSFPSADASAAITYIDYNPSTQIWTVQVETSISSPYSLSSPSLGFLTGTLGQRTPSVSISNCTAVGSYCVQTITYTYPQGSVSDPCLALVGQDMHTFPVSCSTPSCPAPSNFNITLTLHTGNACPATDTITFSEATLSSFSDSSLSTPASSFTINDDAWFGASVQTSEALISSRTLKPNSVCFKPPSGPCYYVNYSVSSPTNGKDPVFVVDLNGPGNANYFNNITQATQFTVSAVVQVNFVGAKGLLKNVAQSQSIQTVSQALIGPSESPVLSATSTLSPMISLFLLLLAFVW